MGTHVKTTVDSPYYSILGDYFATIIVSELLTSDSMRTLTNKQIYSHLLNLPLPKIVREAPPDKDFKPVWQRLSFSDSRRKRDSISPHSWEASSARTTFSNWDEE